MIGAHSLTKDEYAMVLNVLENFKPITVDLRFLEYNEKGYRPIKVDNIYGDLYPSYTHNCVDLETGREKRNRSQYDTIFDLRVKKDDYANIMTIALLIGCGKCLGMETFDGSLEKFRSKWISHERSITGGIDFHEFLLHNFKWIYDHKIEEVNKERVKMFNDQYNYDRVNFTTGQIS